MKSRKIILAVIAVLGAVLGAVGGQFGLALNVTGLFAFIGAAVVYVTQEMKTDIATLKAQKDKWKDPKFWITIVSGLVYALSEQIALPVEPSIIIAVLTGIVYALFKKAPSEREPV